MVKLVSLGWRAFYIERHNELASSVMETVGLVERFSQCESVEAGYYSKAIEDLDDMKLGFKDVEMLLFKPKLNPVLNLVGVQYSINRVGVSVCTHFSTPSSCWFDGWIVVGELCSV